MEPEEPLQPQGQRSDKRRRNRPLSLDALQDLLRRTPQDILMRLASDGGGLSELVRNRMLDPMISRFLALIRKSFTSHNLQAFNGNIRSIVEIVLNSEFLNFTLYEFLRRDGEKTQDQHVEVLEGALKLVDFAVFLSPHFAFQKVFQFPALLRAKLKDVQDGQIQAQLNKFENALRQHDQNQRRVEAGGGQGQDKSRGMRLNADEEQSDDTFRELPLIPTRKDLAAEEKMFIRRNRDTGRYNNLEEYLDVLFRLFRADLIIPLRESIDKYRGTHDAGTHGRGLRIYQDVQIVRPVCTDKHISYRLSFDVGPLSSVDWHTTQRLKFGSLLCLSNDNFETYLCATVSERDSVLLSNGLVDVVFVLDRDELNRVTEVPRDRRFIMVESPAYFEAYRHVLQGLKNLNDHNFPFVRYLVECQPDVQPPMYLQRGGPVRYDFRPLLDDKFVIKDKKDEAADLLAAAGVAVDEEELALNIEAGGIDVMTGRNWPTRDDLKLDETQYRALHNVLTKELAIVQGPPGTGKTYLGLKIIKMLLHNSKAWNDPNQHRPLLIVCYTNHALDQFLESVLEFFQGSLVRVGARSNSEILKEKTLTHFRTRAKASREIPMETHEAKVRARRELQDLRIDIHEKAAMVEIVEQEIVKEKFLQDFIEPKAQQDFRRSLGKNNQGSAILKWLMLELIHERLLYQAEHREKTLPAYKGFARNNLTRPAAQSADYDDDFEDEEDDEIIDVSQSFRDSAQARRLDADDDDDDDEDDLYYQDFDMDNLDLEREESESEKLRRRQREMEAEARRVREENVALDLSGFCEGTDEKNVRDRTAANPSKAKDKEVAESLKKLKLKNKRRLQGLLRDVDRMTETEAEKAQRSNIWKLKVQDRWRLYRYWTDLFCRQLRGEIREHEEKYFDLASKYREILDQEDMSILQKATVIGMTTTAAARYQSILHTIGPRVIVVEEAAEVFEAHVVATLSRECQHLILIGDHKQLRPNPNVYDLAKKGNLDVSLFERMVRNNFQFDCLGFQHRMRPEISRMMTLLYPQLQDHEVVKQMPHVKGMRHDVFYCSHPYPEEKDEETKSYCNSHEAKFVVALCGYLLKQGYRRDQITILSPYASQIHMLSSRMPRKEFEGVRVSSVDNFQGEENDLILLSLVRSNNDNDVGFLKFDNRVCVALSRAKMGMYVIGNFEHLQKSGTLLRQIVERANAERVLGDSLPLACQNHPREDGILATTAEDFKKAPEGGCQKTCDVRLPCGHQCVQTCHPSVPDHAHVACRMPCSRVCPECGQRCNGDHECGDHVRCQRVTEKVIPRCGHRQQLPCGVDPMGAECQAPCDVKLQCGHLCQSTCGRPCTQLCQQEVPVKNQPCGHEFRAPCSGQTTALCSNPCGTELVCGHVCRGTCGECRRGRLHVQCQQQCRKILICGHDCQASCCQCPPCAKPCQNRCVHSRCDRPCGEACVSCAMRCDWQCPHYTCTQPCGELCDRERCNQPCPKRLKCRHPCAGLCGETCPPLCRLCNENELEDLVSGKPEADDRLVLLEDCGHMVEVEFLDHWVDDSRNFYMAETEEEDGAAAGGDGDNRGRVVKFPECPECKTPIRRNFRYGNVIKEALMEMEVIKSRCRGDQTSVDKLKRKVDLAETRVPADLRAQVIALVSRDKVLCESLLATQFYQITMVTDAGQLLRQVTSARTQWPDMRDTYDAVQQDLQHLQQWMLEPRNILSNQELFDVRQEFQRLQILIHLLHCRDAIASGDCKQVKPRLRRSLAACIRVLMAGNPVSENDLEEGRQLKEELKDVVVDPFTALTDEEREEIVKAVQLPTGSWYACPKGHYYVIGECGRPTEVATCPECHSAIGGEHHALREDNRQAPEFDNAEGPRWSEQQDFEMAWRLQMEDWANWQ